MQSLDEVKEEEELKKKINQKKRVRGVLIVVNALLLAYTGYLGVTSIVDLVNHNNKTNIGDIICVLNKSESESKKLYDKYATSNVDVLDVATYGRYLLTSDSKITSDLDKVTDKVRLFNLKDAVNEDDYKYQSIDLGTKLNEQIDLYSLKVGDYIIHNAYNATEFQTFHYTGEELYNETIYSFPNEEGRRNKITIKGKASSPALVINVSTQVDLPSSYYDIVIIKDKSISDENVGMKWFESKNLKIKEVSTLQEAYKVNASYAINVIEGDAIYSSNYVNDSMLKPTKITEGEYKDLDLDDAIRELGGYVFKAGSGLKGDSSYEKASREIMKVKKSSHVGKYTLSVGKDVDDPYNTIKSIFKF